MSFRNNTKTLLMTFGAALALAGCGNGADSVVSPGEGAFPPPPPPVSPPPPPPVTPPPPTGGPAADCPTPTANVGTVADGTLRACQLPATIAGNVTLKKIDGLVYAISGQVNVGTDAGGDSNAIAAGSQQAILTIEPGVKLFGSAGADFLVVNRGSQLFAVGSSTAPIVFTSRASIEGQTGVDSIGQWGGVVVLGRAPINACPGTTLPGTPECQTGIEGVNNAFYGGNNANDNSGRMEYVRVQHSGYTIAANNELNGISFGGVGRGTVVDHVQVHNSSDDGIEIFGGSVNLKHVVLTGNDDDSLDTDTGWNGALQFGIVVQRAGGGDRMNEMSNAGGATRTPVSNPHIANVTYVGRSTGGGVGILMNTATNSEFYNVVVTGSSAGCLDVDDASTGTNGKFNSVFFSCATAFADDADGAAAALFNAGVGNTANGTSTLASTFINGANETAVAAYASLTSVSTFFQNVDYVGGVKNAADTWWQGWTCGLTADTPC